MADERNNRQDVDDITATLNELQERMDEVERSAKEAIDACRQTAKRFEDLANAVEYSLGNIPVTTVEKLLLELKRTVKTGVRSGTFLLVVAGIGFGVKAMLK